MISKIILKIFNIKKVIEEGSNIIKQKGNNTFIGEINNDLLNNIKNLNIKNSVGELQDNNGVILYKGEVFLNSGMVISTNDNSYFSVTGINDFSFCVKNHKQTIVFNTYDLDYNTIIVVKNVVLNFLKPIHI